MCIGPAIYEMWGGMYVPVSMSSIFAEPRIGDMLTGMKGCRPEDAIGSHQETTDSGNTHRPPRNPPSPHLPEIRRSGHNDPIHSCKVGIGFGWEGADMGGSGRGARLIAAVSVLCLGLGGVILSADDPKSDPSALIASKATKTYHRSDCKSARTITAKNKVEVASIEDARARASSPARSASPTRPTPTPSRASPTTARYPSSPKGKTPKKGTAKPSAKKGEMPADDGEMPADGGMPANLKGKGKKGSAAKGSAKKAEATEVAGDDKAMKFSRDIAPILAGNCGLPQQPAEARRVRHHELPEAHERLDQAAR